MVTAKTRILQITLHHMKASSRPCRKLMTHLLILSFGIYFLCISQSVISDVNDKAKSVEPHAFTSKIVNIGVDEWPPYETASADHYGGALRIITESFGLEGVDVGYVWMPWKRCLVMAASGEIDGAALSQRTALRENDFHFSDPIMSVEKVFFHMKSSEFSWKNYDDLKGLTVGIPRGNVYGVEFENAKREGKFITEEVVSQFEQNFKKLLYGRIHLFPAEKEAGYDYLRQHFSSQGHLFTHNPKSIQLVTYHLVLSKKIERNKQMIQHFNHGLRQLKRQGKDKRYLSDSIQGKYHKKH